MPFRADRLASQIQTELSSILQTKMKDPRVSFVTVTRVEVNKDYKFATVWVSSLEDDPTKREEMVQVLTGASGFLRGQLGQVMRVRALPELRFELDRSTDSILRVNQLLEEIHDHQTHPDGDSGEPPQGE